MKIHIKYDLSAITECIITDINFNLKSRKICNNTKAEEKEKLFECTKPKQIGISIEIKDHHKKMNIDEFSYIIDPIAIYMQRQIDKHVFEQILKSSAKEYVIDDIFGTKYDVNIDDPIIKENYCSIFEKTNKISLEDAHEARLNDRIIKLQKLTKSIDFDGVLLVDEFMTNMKDSFEKIEFGIGIPFLKYEINNELPPFWKGAIIGKDAVEFCEIDFDKFDFPNKHQLLPGMSCTSSDNGISVRSTITFEPVTMKTFLHIDCIFCCIIYKDKIMFLKEESCILRNY